MKIKKNTRNLSGRVQATMSIGTAASVALLTSLSTGTASAAPLQNNVAGEVERIIVDDPTDRWSRGTIVVAGQNIIIPRNMVIDLPANRQTLQELFVNAPSACAADGNGDGVPDQTGLAKADACNSSFTGASVTILANKTNGGNVVAGDVFLEKATELVSGIVTYINYDDGYFRVDGDPASPQDTGAMVRVNDPEGRFTHQVGAGCTGSGPNCSADVRYGVDPDNYTFTASTGYPMCIPSTTPRGPYDFDVDRSGAIEPGEVGLSAVATAGGTGDALCPESNRPGGGNTPVADSRLFAPIMVGDHVNAEGNFETIDNVTFLSAHTVGVSVALTTDLDSFQPDYMIFDEVGWDVPGFQNQRVRDLLIGFTTLPDPGVDIFGLYYDPAINDVHEVVFATTVGCDIAAGLGTCTSQGIVGNNGIFKIVHDVDFLNGVPIGDRRSPCAHLQAAYANGGIPDKDGNLVTTDPFGRCTIDAINIGNLGQEFAVLSPPTRDIIGRSRHKHTLDPSVVTLDFHAHDYDTGGSQNGEYLNPTGIGHPEFVEINLAGLDTPLIFAGEPWNMDRRLGPGGGCDGEATCETDTTAIPIGDPSMSLDPFPFSALDPGTQAGGPGTGGVPLVAGYGGLQRGRLLSYYPLTGAQIMAWPPADPAPETITPTQHAGLMCTVLSGIDSDGDGVDDALDNCTLVPNASQLDTNSDGYGNACDADLNNDGSVGIADLGIFRSAFGQLGANDADFDGNNSVGLSDLGIFRSAFGGVPGPSCCGL